MSEMATCTGKSAPSPCPVPELPSNGGKEEAWDGEEAGQKRIHRASDIELYESRLSYEFWDEGSPDRPRPMRTYLPWKESPAEQLVDMSLFEFYRFVEYHGGRRPYLCWRDPTGKKPSAFPIVCMQPRVSLREGAGFARNAQWALVQYHPWQNRADRLLATDDKGEPRHPEFVKDFFRNWVESDRCPWYIQEQYDHDNNRGFR